MWNCWDLFGPNLAGTYDYDLKDVAILFFCGKRHILRRWYCKKKGYVDGNSANIVIYI